MKNEEIKTIDDLLMALFRAGYLVELHQGIFNSNGGYVHLPSYIIKIHSHREYCPICEENNGNHFGRCKNKIEQKVVFGFESHLKDKLISEVIKNVKITK